MKLSSIALIALTCAAPLTHAAEKAKDAAPAMPANMMDPSAYMNMAQPMMMMPMNMMNPMMGSMGGMMNPGMMMMPMQMMGPMMGGMGGMMPMAPPPGMDPAAWAKQMEQMQQQAMPAKK
jgi:hypothetical protein